MVGVTALGNQAAFAASDAPMAGMDHSSHQAGKVAKPQAAVPAAAAPMDHSKMKMGEDEMPTTARDPNAYSDGYTLDSGPYVLSDGSRLRLGDEKAYATFLVDNLEAVRANGKTTGSYDAMARIGRDYDKLVIKAEGEVANGKIQESRTEALWSHAFAPFWDSQLGVRLDSGVGPSRTWLAFGVQGLAPYWFDVSATAYAGSGGRSALRLSAEYELLITQKLVLQPRVEANFYGKTDAQRGVGKGLSDVTSGIRLRYEFSRQFAPYIGVERASRFGSTADLARAAGEPASVTRYVAGVRFWF